MSLFTVLVPFATTAVIQGWRMLLDTGGAIHDICTSVVDAQSTTTFWTDFATEILTFESNGIFGLSPETASATDFTVTVNGQVQNSGWTFDGAINGIVFGSNSMPPSGATISDF